MGKKNKKFKLSRALMSLTPLVGKALGDYAMIQKGDRILVAISGGKDSMLLWPLLRYFQSVAPVEFEIAPIFVDAGIPGFPVQELKDYFAAQGTPCRVEVAHELKGKSWEEIDCFVCSRQRRKILFETAEEMKFNKLAMGHNLDDIAETILLNLFFRGEIGAMRPAQDFFKKTFMIIRPLAYVRAEEIEGLVRAQEIFTFSGNKCPKDQDSQRVHLRHLLRDLEKHNPAVQKNIVSALKNIRTEYLL